MLIRPLQLRIIEEALWRDLAAELLRALRVELPEHVAAVGDDAARSIIESAVDRARQAGFTSRPGAAMFVRFTFLFGEHFEEKHDWARQAIARTKNADERSRCTRLADAALDHLRAVPDWRKEQ
jgi:hypothetical protein